MSALLNRVKPVLGWCFASGEGGASSSSSLFVCLIFCVHETNQTNQKVQ